MPKVNEVIQSLLLSLLLLRTFAALLLCCFTALLLYCFTAVLICNSTAEAHLRGAKVNEVITLFTTIVTASSQLYPTGHLRGAEVNEVEDVCVRVVQEVGPVGIRLHLQSGWGLQLLVYEA